MLKASFFGIILFCEISAMAQVGPVGPVGSPATPPPPGINEAVTISYKNGVWLSYPGSAVNTGMFVQPPRPFKRLIPVSHEAFAALANLKKDSAYNCIIGQSTYVGEPISYGTIYMNDHLAGTFYVLSINCGS